MNSKVKIAGFAGMVNLFRYYLLILIPIFFYNYIESIKVKIIEAGNSSRETYELFRDLRNKLVASMQSLDHDAARDDYERARLVWAPLYEQPGGELVDKASFNPTGICLNGYTILSNDLGL